MSVQTSPGDTIQTLLDLCEGECDDFLLGNGDDGSQNAPKWYALGYWRNFLDATGDGEWELSVKGDTLREVLCAFIADPRFGQ